MQCKSLVGQLLETLSSTTEALEVFISPGGDIAYLQDMKESQKAKDQMVQAIESISQTFNSLKYTQQRLRRVDEHCRKYADIVRSSVLVPLHLTYSNRAVGSSHDHREQRSRTALDFYDSVDYSGSLIILGDMSMLILVRFFHPLQ